MDLTRAEELVLTAICLGFSAVLVFAAAIGYAAYRRWRMWRLS